MNIELTPGNQLDRSGFRLSMYSRIDDEDTLLKEFGATPSEICFDLPRPIYAHVKWANGDWEDRDNPGYYIPAPHHGDWWLCRVRKQGDILVALPIEFVYNQWVQSPPRQTDE